MVRMRHVPQRIQGITRVKRRRLAVWICEALVPVALGAIQPTLQVPGVPGRSGREHTATTTTTTTATKTYLEESSTTLESLLFALAVDVLGMNRQRCATPRLVQWLQGN